MPLTNKVSSSSSSIPIQSGHVPDTMELAKVIPIYKSNDKQMLNNYRPIGGTITTIASLFIYQCCVYIYNNCGKTTFGLYGARLSLPVYGDISLAFFILLTFYCLFEK